MATMGGLGGTTKSTIVKHEYKIVEDTPDDSIVLAIPIPNAAHDSTENSEGRLEDLSVISDGRNRPQLTVDSTLNPGLCGTLIASLMDDCSSCESSTHRPYLLNCGHLLCEDCLATISQCVFCSSESPVSAPTRLFPAIAGTDVEVGAASQGDIADTGAAFMSQGFVSDGRGWDAQHYVQEALENLAHFEQEHLSDSFLNELRARNGLRRRNLSIKMARYFHHLTQSCELQRRNAALLLAVQRGRQAVVELEKKILDLVRASSHNHRTIA